jgi:hypothetical protein
MEVPPTAIREDPPLMEEQQTPPEQPTAMVEDLFSVAAPARTMGRPAKVLSEAIEITGA